MVVKKRQSSMTDVAVLAGVSLGTVSNYYNRPEKVSAERRRRVEAAVAELGFVPNGLARALARGHQQVVALVVLDLNNPYFSIVARGMEDRLAPEGIMLTVASSDEDPDRERACLRLLEEHTVAGVVITPAGPSLRFLERLRSRGTPAVLLGRRPPADGSWCAVSGDDAVGGALIARHLLELGHQRVGYLNGAGMTRLDTRRENLRSSVEAAGRKFTEVVAPNMTIAGGEIGAQELLESAELPTALVCANDLLALGVLRVLERNGLHVPDDLALVGYDDVDFARSLSVPLTTVRQDKYLLGQQAAELLLRELRDEDHEHSDVLLSVELVVRASTIGHVRAPTSAVMSDAEGRRILSDGPTRLPPAPARHGRLLDPDPPDSGREVAIG